MSGLAQYQVNSNSTSEQLILRERSRRGHFRARLKMEETSHLFSLGTLENPPVCLWRRLPRANLLLAGTFSSHQGSAPGKVSTELLQPPRGLKQGGKFGAL